MQVIIFIMLTVGFAVWLFSRMFSTTATVKSMAKIQLGKYKDLTRGASSLTDDKKDDFYLKLIQSRPGLTKSEDEAYEVRATAHDLASKRDGFVEARVNLMWVVVAMWAQEQAMHGKHVSGTELTKAYHAVRSVISEEL